jgi:hypothetical protein
VPSREPSDRPAPDAGVPALWLALAGCLGAGLLVFGVYDDRIPLGLAIPLFFGIPLSEFAALVWGLWAGRDTWPGRIAALIAALVLGGWGYVLWKFATTPLRLF